MDKVFAPLLYKGVKIYLDDILIHSKTAAEHVDGVLSVLQCLENAVLYCNAKCNDIAIFPLFFLYAAPFRYSCYTPLHHRPTIHRFSSISSIAVAHRAPQLRRVDRHDLIAYMKRIRRMMHTDAIETHSRRRVSHASAPPGFHM